MQLDRAAVTLHYFLLQAEMYTEDAGAHNTVLEGMKDKSRPQRAERRVQTTTEPQTTEGQQVREETKQI